MMKILKMLYELLIKISEYFIPFEIYVVTYSLHYKYNYTIERPLVKKRLNGVTQAASSAPQV